MKPVRTIRPSGPFDSAWIRAFFEARLVPGLEQLDAERYIRSVRLDGDPVVLTLRFTQDTSGRGTIQASSTPSLPSDSLERLVVTLFDLDADLAQFHRCVRSESSLSRLVARRPGIRLTLYLDPFEGLLRAIVGQQVSLGAARTMLGRLVARFGPAVKGHSLMAFPTPRRIRDVGLSAIQSLGLTRAKARSVYSAAEASLDGRLDWARFQTAPADEAQAALLGLDGVGPWTASYVRMRVLGDRDAFPESDLGVIKAVSALMNSREHLAPRRILQRAERWRPWRAYAMLHLWSSLADLSRGSSDRRGRHDG